MLMPKRVKYRKQMRGRMKGKAGRGSQIAFGEYGLQALEPCWMTSRQIEAARRAVVRYVKRGGKLWIRVFPDKPVTVKPAETRMGSGKGNVDHWVAVVKPGRIVLEIAGEKQVLKRNEFIVDSCRKCTRREPVGVDILMFKQVLERVRMVRIVGEEEVLLVMILCLITIVGEAHVHVLSQQASQLDMLVMVLMAPMVLMEHWGLVVVVLQEVL